MTSPTKVTLLGKGWLAVQAATWLVRDPAHDLEVVVPVIPEPIWTDSLSDWSREHEVALVASGDYRDLKSIMGESWTPGLVISIFYDKILQADFLERCTRAINLHNGPLPRYRGVEPINWALKNEEQMHGVTIHEITPGIDDGPVISQSLYSIYPDTDEVIDVYQRALLFGQVLFETTMPMLPKIKARPQDSSQATYYSRKDSERLGDRRRFTRAQSLEAADDG